MKTVSIKNETHMIRIGEKRKFDHKLSSLDFIANVDININSKNNTFFIVNPETPTDDCGFVKVVVSYQAVKAPIY